MAALLLVSNPFSGLLSPKGDFHFEADSSLSRHLAAALQQGKASGVNLLVTTPLNVQKVNKDAQNRTHQQAQKGIHYYSRVQATNRADSATQQSATNTLTYVER
jgi:hypothetical protein